MRRAIFALGLGGCSIWPDRPFQEIRRFTLAPERPVSLPPPPRGPVLLVRAFRAAPGLEERGLRRVTANGTVANAVYEEWVAPPAELAEAALRRWLAASGMFAAVVAPGSRIDATLVLEAELSRLDVMPGAARATIGGVLLDDRSRLLRPFVAEGSAALPGAGVPPAPEAASAMGAALGAAFGVVESELRRR